MIDQEPDQGGDGDPSSESGEGGQRPEQSREAVEQPDRVDRIWKRFRGSRYVAPIIVAAMALTAVLNYIEALPDWFVESIDFWTPTRAVLFHTPHEELQRKGQIYVFENEDAVVRVDFDEESKRLEIGSYRALVLVQSQSILERPLPLSKGSGAQVTEFSDRVTISGQVARGPMRNTPVPNAVLRCQGVETHSGRDGRYVLSELPLQSSYKVEVYSEGPQAVFTSSKPWWGVIANARWHTDLPNNVWFEARQ